ncbi:MAG: hypothetical protein NC388_03940 [Clostridium sp.]|nr:hypothetical protein [Clostridium sp.]
MDYKYIEQLLERYWAGQTSLNEENILRMFFEQEDVPVHLQRYKSLFKDYALLAQIRPDESLDKRLNTIDAQRPVVKAHRITYMQRLSPLYKAAAVVAITLTLGNAAQSSFQPEEEEYNYSSYQDSYSSPEAAYRQVSDALKLVSERLNEANRNDSLNTIDVSAEQ